MSRRAFLLYGGLLLALVAGQVAMLLYVRRGGAATLECRAENAGIPLAAADGEVFVHAAGRAERIVARGPVGQPLRVGAGSYDVRVVYTRATPPLERWIPGVSVAPGEHAVREASFSAGELRVDVVVGEEAAQPGQAVIQLFRTGSDDEVLAALAASQTAILSAGRYDARVVWTVDAAEKEAIWLREVEVRSGLRERRSVAFQRGTLRVRARNAGRPLPPGAVTLTIYHAGDVQREVVDEGPADLPLGLPNGRYDVEVTFSGSSDRPRRWLRGLEVDGDATERTVEFASGTLVVHAELPGGESLDGFRVYVHCYAPRDHRQALAYVPAGEPLVLETGRYDVRAKFQRSHDQPELWLHEVAVEAGRTTTERVVFDSGRLLVRVFDPSGEELRGDELRLQVFASGQRTRPCARARGGEELVLEAGVYDVLVEETRRPGAPHWLPEVPLTGGRRTTRNLTLSPTE